MPIPVEVASAETKTRKRPDGSEYKITYLGSWDKNNHNKKVYMREEVLLKEVEKVFKSMQLKPDLLEEIQLYIKDSANAEKDYYKKRLSELYAENTKIKTRMDRLMDCYLDGKLSKKEHEEKRLELTQKRENTVREIEAHNKADDNFVKMLISLLELSSNAFDRFTGSTVEDKRGLVNLVFANLELNSEKLDYNLRPPFNNFVNLSENRRMAHPRGVEPLTL